MGEEISSARNQEASTCHLLACWFLAELISPTMEMEAICSSETLVDNGLHGVISQKMVVFITTAVKTSNPTIVSLSSPVVILMNNSY
jgi:hypothetical protein